MKSSNDNKPLFQDSKPLFQALILFLTTLILTSGCSGNKAPEPIPAQTSTQAGPQLEPPPQLPPPVRQVRPTAPSTLKVIDPGGEEEEEPKTLYEASQLAKAIKRQGGEPDAVAEINDENLHEYAEKAEIIMLEGDPAVPPPSLLRSREEPAESGDGRDEQYWRNGALQIRMSWRRALDQIDELELESAALRQQFYAEEDTYIRDGHIKPEWDRVLDRLNQLRDQAGRYEGELERFVEEGRTAGALPGWLTEGWELEPQNEERGEDEEPRQAHQAAEPQVVNEVIDP